jgi:V-type H+-transporting ATPase subunit D
MGGGAGQRPPANRMMLQQFKARLTGAKKGHGLLKKKRDALKARFQQMLKEIVVAKKGVVTGIKDCSFSMAKATWASGNISSSIMEKVKKPTALLKANSENVAGVFLPKFALNVDSGKESPFSTFGVGAGGKVVATARETHSDTLVILIKMASLQTSFVTLDAAIKTTSRRVNALEFVVMPRMEDIISYIKTEMDEMEREEFFRVKKVVEKKREKMAREALEDALQASGAAAAPDTGKPVQSALGEKDPDLLF